MVVVALPAFQQDFSISRAGASIPYTMVMVGFGIGGIVTGRFVDRFGVARPIAFCAIALGLSCLAAAKAGSLWLFSLTHIFIGWFGCSAVFGPLVAEDPRPERVVLVGRDLVVWGPGFRNGAGYTFLTLSQFEGEADVAEVTARDMNGDGAAEILVRGTRHLAPQGGGDKVAVSALFVYEMKEGRLARIFGIETGRELGPNRVQGLVQMVPARSGKGFDFDVRPGVAKGWTEKTYPWPQEQPGIPHIIKFEATRPHSLKHLFIIVNTATHKFMLQCNINCPICRVSDFQERAMSTRKTKSPVELASDFVADSIETAKTAFGPESDVARQNFDAMSQSAKQVQEGFTALQSKGVAYAESNAKALFAFWRDAVAVKSPEALFNLQQDFFKNQSEAAVKQFQDLNSATLAFVKDSAAPVQANWNKVFSGFGNKAA